MTSSTNNRAFAVEVVRRLVAAGFQALWAGGCVRDQVMGRVPKDYDVATDARPEQVREVFGRRMTIPIGVAFGVIAVRGPQGVEPVEVATFRRDAEYSDGRHPDSVVFSTAADDALRRDFTVNGLFYDPLEQRVIDFVGGRQDITQQLIRAIRDPFERIHEDKLRMLRAIRFASTLQFTIDPDTLEAVTAESSRIVMVSAERVAAELDKMLTHSQRAEAVRLLRQTGLLEAILPECESTFVFGPARWPRTLDLLRRMPEGDFSMGLAALVFEAADLDGDTQLLDDIKSRLRLSNRVTEDAKTLLTAVPVIHQAHDGCWSRVQPWLVHRRAGSAVQFAAAVALVRGESPNGIGFCRERLSWPPQLLNPPPLIDGNDLIAAGFSPGPGFRGLLQAIRDAQLGGQLTSAADALKMAHQWVLGGSSPSQSSSDIT